MHQLIVVMIVVLAATTCIHGYDETAMFQRYSKMKLLTTCLGEETMARWRQQMRSAGQECKETRPLIPALLHQIQTMSQRQPFVPNAPFIVQQLQSQFRPNPAQVQQQFQQNSYYQQQQLKPQQQNPFYQQPQQLNPFQQQQYYILSSSSNKIQRPQHQYTSVVYPPTSNFKPVVLPGQSWPIYQQGYSFTQSAPGNLAPTVQYITAPTQVELQKLNAPPINEYQESSAGGQSLAEPQVVRQEDTYTNPDIKVEQTEVYQQQQQLLQQQQQQQVAGVQRVPSVGPQVSSFHQRHPFAPLQQSNNRRPAKREAEARWEVYEGVSPSRYPSSQQQSAEAVNEYRLRQMQSQVSDKLSNMTCVLRAMKMLTAELEPDLSFMATSLLELPISHELFMELKSGLQYCREASQCQPRRSQLHDLPITREFSSSLEFFRCFGREKLRACLKADVAAMSQMLGSERGPLSWPEPGSGSGSTFEDALQDLDDLLNGGGGTFVDLVLM